MGARHPTTRKKQYVLSQSMIKPMTIPAIAVALIVTASALNAENFQPYEAGIYPIRSRIERINNIVTTIENRLAIPDLSPEEKKLRSDCLHQYATEKKKLEDDLERGRKTSQSPGIAYLTTEREELAQDKNCTQGLATQSTALNTKQPSTIKPAPPPAPAAPDNATPSLQTSPSTPPLASPPFHARFRW